MVNIFYLAKLFFHKVKKLKHSLIFLSPDLLVRMSKDIDIKFLINANDIIKL